MISFKSVTLKNFLSYGDNPTTFELNRHPTTLIAGSNGFGKTAIITSLSYALFGKTERGIPQRGLINTVNQRDSWSQVVFNKGQHEYTILRGQKPSRLEITKDGVLLNSDAAVRDTQKFIDDLLGFDFNSFLRVVFLSTMGYTPFMQLTAYERRNFVETMLDLKDFTEMNKIHKAEQSRLTEELKSIESSLSIDKALYNEKKKTLELLEKLDGNRVEQTKKELTDLVTKMEEKTLDAAKYTEKYQQEEQKLDKIDNELAFTKKLIDGSNDSIRSYKSTIKHLEEQQSLVSVSKCDSCKQDVDKDHADKILTELDSKIYVIWKDIGILEASSKFNLESYNTRKQERDEIAENKRKYGDLVTRLNTEKSIIGSDIKKKVASINKNVDTTQIDSIKLELDVLRTKLKDGAKQYDEIYKQISLGKTVSVLLNDTGIKASIIKEYIPILVASVNMYLQKLNIVIKFNMDENFNETITTRYANEYTYGNLSAGERARVDLAMVFAWREVAKLKGSVWSSILILDEILDASLDAAGTDDAMSILEEITNDGDTNVFIISHKGALDERCRSIIQLEKVNGFSRIA